MITSRLKWLKWFCNIMCKLQKLPLVDDNAWVVFWWPFSCGVVSIIAFLRSIAVLVLFCPLCRGMASVFPFCIEARHFDMATSHEDMAALDFTSEIICDTCWLPWWVKYPMKTRMINCLYHYNLSLTYIYSNPESETSPLRVCQ